MQTVLQVYRVIALCALAPPLRRWGGATSRKACGKGCIKFAMLRPSRKKATKRKSARRAHANFYVKYVEYMSKKFET